TTKGFLRSTDHGNSWQRVIVNKPSKNSIACTKSGNIFLSSADTVFHSNDGGTTWSPIEDITDSLPYPYGHGIFITNHTGIILFWESNIKTGLVYSDNDGKTWKNYSQKNKLSEISPDADSGFYFSVFGKAIHA